MCVNKLLNILFLIQCLFDDGSGLGVSAIRLIGSRVVAAKLNGTIDFLQLESYSEGQQIDWGFTSYRRSKYLRK